MKICWLTNDKWYSKLLRFIFNEESSHVGVIFNIDGIEIAMDITKPHGDIYSAKSWFSKYRLLYQVELKLTHDQEIEVFKECETFCVMKKYDFPGYIYGMIYGLLRKLHIIKMLPVENRWAGSGDMRQEILRPILKSKIIKMVGGVPEIITNFSTGTERSAPTITAWRCAAHESQRFSWR